MSAAFAGQPAFARIKIETDGRFITATVGKDYSLRVGARPDDDLEGADGWFDHQVCDSGKTAYASGYPVMTGDPSCTAPERHARRVTAQIRATGPARDSFSTLAKSAADQCIAAGQALFEPRGFASWRRACADLLRAGVARAAARDPRFADAAIELQDGITVAAKGRHHAQIVPDVGSYQRFGPAWTEAVGDCQDEHTRCELLRAPGFLAHLVAPPQDAFAVEVREALQSCMRLPPPR